MDPTQIAEMLDAHNTWLETGGQKGKRAELEGADFQGATELREANLQRAILNRAEFKTADLTDADFERAQLRLGNFDGATLHGTNLREADLQNANLEAARSLLSTQLAGADVTGAKLPEAISKFDGLETIAEASSNAQKLFIAMLAGCLYSWLTIGTTKDAALLTDSASSPLPVIGTALPIVGFYLVAPIVLVAVYFYFHLNMQRLWEALADLPAVFTDGRPLDKMADPWLLNGLVRAHFFRLRSERPPLSRLQQWLSILLAWWVVPATLIVFWGRFLMRHDWFGTALHIVLLTAAIGFGWMSYRLARGTLRGAPRKPFAWAQAWKDWKTYKRIAGAFGTCVLGVVFYVISAAAFKGVLADYFGSKAPNNLEEYSLRQLVRRSLEDIGFRPYANLLEEDVSTKPPNWTGDVKEYPLVKGARLRGANMQYASVEDAFLVNAQMRDSNLTGADLVYANLSNANLSNATLANAILLYTNLTDANLSNAHLSGADLTDADLSNANLSDVDLSDATLAAAHLSNADFWSADLSGAELSDADLSNAKIRAARLSKASVTKADLSDANLSDADLSGSNLSNANLSGANLSGANLSDADLSETDLSDVDLNCVKGLSKSQLSKAKINENTGIPANLPP